MMAIEIIKELATTKGYEFLFECSQTRKEYNKGQYVCILYWGDDISEEVANILAKRRADQAGADQLSTKPADKAPTEIQPSPPTTKDPSR